jgi:Flp pilus assembly protein TadB
MLTLAGVLVGAGFAGSLVLLVAASTGWHLPKAANGRRRFRRPDLSRAGAAVGAGAVVAVATRWPVAVVAAAVLVSLWPKFFGGTAAGRAQIARLEALATWTESMRDTIAGATSLEQAIPASVDAAPPALQPYLRRLAGMLRARIPVPQALASFGDDLDDASADLVVAALVLNARLHGPKLVDTLSALASSIREELDMRRRVETGRRSLRRSAQIIIAVTVAFATGLAVFSRQYVAPYSSVTGQVVLAGVIAIFGAGFVWLRRLADAEQPERFLIRPDDASMVAMAGRSW